MDREREESVIIGKGEMEKRIQESDKVRVLDSQNPQAQVLGRRA